MRPTFAYHACFLEFRARIMPSICRERGVDEGHMDDDLMGRLVANAGVDCTAAGLADSGVTHFLLTRAQDSR
jgi:hypothetical protein